MILFAHLAGLLMAGRSMPAEATPPSLAETADGVTDDRDGGDRPRSWPRPDVRCNGDATGHDRLPSVTTATHAAVQHGHDRARATAMSAAEARWAVVRLVREGGSRTNITPADVQRLTGRGERQARRLLALAAAETNHLSSEIARPRVVDGEE